MEARVEYIFNQETKGDTSFTDRGFFGITPKYKQSDVREIWRSGIKHGIEIGLRKASVEGQIVELHNNTEDPKEKEFLDKLISLTNEYGLVLQHHPEVGLKVIRKKR